MATQSTTSSISASIKLGGYTSDMNAVMEFVFTSDNVNNKFLVQFQSLTETRKNSWTYNRYYWVGIGSSKTDAQNNARRYYLPGPASTVSGGTSIKTVKARRNSSDGAWEEFWNNNKEFDGNSSTGKCPTIYVYLKMYTNAGSGYEKTVNTTISTSLVNTQPALGVSVAINHPQYSDENDTYATSTVTVSNNKSYNTEKQYSTDGGSTWKDYSSAVTLNCYSTNADFTVKGRARVHGYSEWQSASATVYCSKPPAPTVSLGSVSRGWPSTGQTLTVPVSVTSAWYVDKAILYGRANSTSAWTKLSGPHSFAATKGPISLSTSLAVKQGVSTQTPYQLSVRTRREANGAYSNNSGAVSVHYQCPSITIKDIKYTTTGNSVTFTINAPFTVVSGTNIYYRVWNSSKTTEIINDTQAATNTTSKEVTITNDKLKDSECWLQVWGHTASGAQSESAYVNLDFRKSTGIGLQMVGVTASKVTFKVTGNTGAYIKSGNTVHKVNDEFEVNKTAGNNTLSVSGWKAYTQNGIYDRDISGTISPMWPDLSSCGISTVSSNGAQYPQVKFTPNFSGSCKITDSVSNTSKTVTTTPNTSAITAFNTLLNKQYSFTAQLTQNSWVCGGSISVATGTSYIRNKDIGSYELRKATVSTCFIAYENQKLSYQLQFSAPVKGNLEIYAVDTDNSTEKLHEKTFSDYIWSIEEDVQKDLVTGTGTLKVRGNLTTATGATSSFNKEGSTFVNYIVKVQSSSSWLDGVPLVLSSGVVAPLVYDGTNWVDNNGKYTNKRKR